MIQAVINNETYNIPEKWEDMTYGVAVSVFIAHHSGTHADEIISRACLIPLDVLHNTSVTSVSKLSNRLEFLSDLSVFENAQPKEEYKDFDYGSILYGKAQKCRQSVDEQKSMLENVVPMFKELFGVDLTYESFTEWIGTVNFFLKQWFHSTIASPLSKMGNTLMSKNLPESDDLKSSEPLVLT